MSKRRILIIDDETSLSWLLKLNLERTGQYDVRTAAGGQAGLAAAREYRPDLVLLDLMMPDMDGSVVASCLKDDPALTHTPIVFLTAAVAQEEAAAQGGVIGGYPFLAKPVTLERVLACIDEQFHHTEDR